MIKPFNRNEADEEAQDIHNDVSQLADSQAKSLLSETRARIHGRSRLQQSVRDVADTSDSYIHDKPWQSVSAAAAVGIFIGILLGCRR